MAGNKAQVEHEKVYYLIFLKSTHKKYYVKIFVTFPPWVL